MRFPLRMTGGRMISRFLLERFSAGMASLAVMGLAVIVAGVVRTGPEALAVGPGGMVAGALAAFLILGLGNYFNPLCQDGCSVAASAFFIVASVLITALFIGTGSAVVIAGEAVLSAGIALGVAAGAWIVALRPAKRRVEGRKSPVA